MPLISADEFLIVIPTSLEVEGLMQSHKYVILVQWGSLETEVLKLGE